MKIKLPPPEIIQSTQIDFKFHTDDTNRIFVQANKKMSILDQKTKNQNKLKSSHQISSIRCPIRFKPSLSTKNLI